MIKKLLWRIVKRYKLHEPILALINQDKVNLSYHTVSNYGGVFYPEAIVYNINGDINKIKIKNATHIRGELLVFKYGGCISIGENCFIGTGSKIWSGESVTIGNNVLISHNVNIIDTNSHEIDALERAESYKNLLIYGHSEKKGSIKTAPIIIEDFVWISFNVTILKGVTIGKGAIVAANSVITKNVESFTLVAGNPAKVVKLLKPQLD